MEQTHKVPNYESNTCAPKQAKYQNVSLKAQSSEKNILVTCGYPQFFVVSTSSIPC